MKRLRQHYIYASPTMWIVYRGALARALQSLNSSGCFPGELRYILEVDLPRYHRLTTYIRNRQQRRQEWMKLHYPTWFTATGLLR